MIRMIKVPMNHLRVQMLVSVTDHEGRCVSEHCSVLRDFDGVRADRVAQEAVATFKEMVGAAKREARRD